MTLSSDGRSSARARGRAASASAAKAGREIEPELLRNSLAYAIRRTVARCDAILMRHLDSEISPARLSALSCVGANPGISQAALGALLNIAGPSVVSVVDDLEKVGMLQRASSSDRRVYALHLTDTGRDRLKRYTTAVKRSEAAIATALTHNERRDLILLLKKVAAEEA